jgi:hypothetical protein
VVKELARTETGECSINAEMSGLINLEMSSFGVYSIQVDRMGVGAWLLI